MGRWLVVWLFGQEQIGSLTYILATEPPQIAAAETGGVPDQCDVSQGLPIPRRLPVRDVE